MPTIPILMPQLGESIAEATIIRILVEAGRSVEAASDLFEVETNKATMSVTAPCAGKITQIIAVPQTSYAVGSTLAAFEISEEDAQNLGFADTPQAMFDYLRHEVQGVVGDETLMRFCQESAQTVRWLMARASVTT